MGQGELGHRVGARARDCDRGDGAPPRSLRLPAGKYIENHGVVHNMFYNTSSKLKLPYHATLGVQRWWDNGSVPIWITAQRQVMPTRRGAQRGPPHGARGPGPGTEGRAVWGPEGRCTLPVRPKPPRGPCGIWGGGCTGKGPHSTQRRVTTKRLCPLPRPHPSQAGQLDPRGCRVSPGVPSPQNVRGASWGAAPCQ